MLSEVKTCYVEILKYIPLTTVSKNAIVNERLEKSLNMPSSTPWWFYLITSKTLLQLFLHWISQDLNLTWMDLHPSI